MKSISFSSLNPMDIERLKEAQCAESFILIFKQILHTLNCENRFSSSSVQPAMDNVTNLLGNKKATNPCPKNIRFFPSFEAFNKLERHFQIVRRYVVLLKRPHSLCGRWKIRRKIRKTNYKISEQEFYSAIIYLFMHKGLGNVDVFKALLKEE